MQSIRKHIRENFSVGYLFGFGYNPVVLGLLYLSVILDYIPYIEVVMWSLLIMFGLGMVVGISSSGGEVTTTYNQRLHGMEKHKHVDPGTDFGNGYVDMFAIMTIIGIIAIVIRQFV